MANRLRTNGLCKLQAVSGNNKPSCGTTDENPALWLVDWKTSRMVRCGGVYHMPRDIMMSHVLGVTAYRCPVRSDTRWDYVYIYIYEFNSQYSRKKCKY